MSTPTAAPFAATLHPGMRMRDLFDTAKAAMAMPVPEVASLFDHTAYEVRLGACCILDFRARARRTGDAERRRLYDLNLDHHDAIDDWGMVDRAAPSVLGGYLLGRSKAPLHELATSDDPIRRRTAITAPLWWIRYGEAADLAEVFPLAARLAGNPMPVVHNAVGIALKPPAPATRRRCSRSSRSTPTRCRGLSSGRPAPSSPRECALVAHGHWPDVDDKCAVTARPADPPRPDRTADHEASRRRV